MTFGRPTMVTHASNVPLPFLTDEVDNANTLPSMETPSRIEYLLPSVRLSTVLEKILVQVYQPWRGKSKGDETNAEDHRCSNFNTIIDIDSELICFESSVPNHLSWITEAGAPDAASDILLMQRNVIQGQ